MSVPAAGGAVAPIASEPDPGDIAADATAIYWTNTQAGTVRRILFAGGVPTTLASAQSAPSGIAVDAQNVYFSNNAGMAAGMKNSLMKVAPGGGPITTLASGASYEHVALGAKNIYWTSPGDGMVMELGPR